MQRERRARSCGHVQQHLPTHLCTNSSIIGSDARADACQQRDSLRGQLTDSDGQYVTGIYARNASHWTALDELCFGPPDGGRQVIFYCFWSHRMRPSSQDTGRLLFVSSWKRCELACREQQCTSPLRCSRKTGLDDSTFRKQVMRKVSRGQVVVNQTPARLFRSFFFLARCKSHDSRLHHCRRAFLVRQCRQGCDAS